MRRAGIVDIVSGRLRNFHLVLAPNNPNPRSVASDCDMRVARCRWRNGLASACFLYFNQ